MGNTPAPPPDGAARARTTVALLPKHGNTWVTPADAEKAKQGKGVSLPLPVLPLLPSAAGALCERDVRARASARIAETFERIAGWWIEGAELPAAALEAEIDRATVAGDLGALRAALSVYEQGAREACAGRGGDGEAPRQT